MAREKDLQKKLFQSLILYIREHHPEAIDKAYEFFWDEMQPDECIGGTALEMGFLNFEDWLAIDYRINADGETFIDRYIIDCSGLSKEEVSHLRKIQETVLSLFEVVSVARDKRVIIRDLLLEGEHELRDKTLTRGLKKGDIFAARILNLDGRDVLSGAVYPFTTGHRKRILNEVERQFRRFRKNVRNDGTMKEYLKDYGDIFNLLWLKFIIEPVDELREKTRQEPGKSDD